MMTQEQFDNLQRGDQFLVNNGILQRLGGEGYEVHVYFGRFQERYDFGIYINGEGGGSGSPTKEDLLSGIFEYEKIEKDHPSYVEAAVEYSQQFGQFIDTLNTLAEKEANGEEVTSEDIQRVLKQK